MTHQFNVEIAEKYGILESIILCNLYYWIEKNKANGTNYEDGRTWTYNSIKAYSELFPYANEGQIRRALKKLESEGLILIGNYNKVAFDRTSWYALSDYAESIFQNENIDFNNIENPSSKNETSIYQKCKMEDSETENGCCKNETPIPNINTDINTDINTSINTDDIENEDQANKSGKPIRHKYGEFKNVLLSDEDIEKLKLELPDDYLRLIEKLSKGMHDNKYKYKNHLMALRAWAKKEKEWAQEKQAKQQTPPINNNTAPADIPNWQTEHDNVIWDLKMVYYQGIESFDRLAGEITHKVADKLGGADKMFTKDSAGNKIINMPVIDSALQEVLKK